ncbi:lipoprotein-releasing system ATP-binding protein LolD [Mixta theicola]|uniref:Lipoprotein-releasing system ATP-binding protein LolD n=1 Tax=Mixta theicola TaxID=1458355 RepID=A0A2K1QEH3_9GAMM|nr:ABC transporter ATP-binding protein [Mixta theicola]PNS13431.1 lipoprotein-releasing system ATP-binding protein LolD [Mixta theicola]GLR09745.1 lipoprotein ABC transporter ATP-binding protein LolD [Mixta theicola]
MASNIRELPAIALSGVNKSYGRNESRVDALKAVNLEIAHGEFVALCGPSGSGKSTLLNILSGIDRPSSGTVMLFCKLLDALNEQQLSVIRGQHLGFIFQSFNLIPVLNALDNVRYPLLLNGRYQKKEARERALHYLNSVGLFHLANRKPGQLSGGQQQRVAIARALAHQPKLVVADEPTGNLDLATGGAILDLLIKINQETGTTFIISTHSAQLKERAGRIVEIRDGEVDEN